MKDSTSLCFTKDGLINPSAINFMHENATPTVVMFCDGSKDGLRRIVDYKFERPDFVTKVGLAKSPLYELRVIGQDKKLSNPHYVYDEDTRQKWLCAKVAAPHLKLYMRATRSRGGSLLPVGRKETESVCYLASKLWNMILKVEEHLAFPAVFIERLISHTHYLDPRTMNMKKLQSLFGSERIEYHGSKMLNLTVGDQLFAVGLKSLNRIYDEMVLPLYRDLQGRRIEWFYNFDNEIAKTMLPEPISIGLLGRLVEEMRSRCSEKIISDRRPIAAEDLVLFSKKVDISEDICLWESELTSIKGLATQELYSTTSDVWRPYDELQDASLPFR